MGDVYFSLNIFCRNSDIHHRHGSGVFKKALPPMELQCSNTNNNRSTVIEKIRPNEC